jgi:acyl carrier protein
MWDKEFDCLLHAALKIAEDQPVEPDQELLDSVDSLELMGLVVELENHYGIEFSDELLSMEYLATPAGLWSGIQVSQRAADLTRGARDPGTA